MLDAQARRTPQTRTRRLGPAADSDPADSDQPQTRTSRRLRPAADSDQPQTPTSRRLGPAADSDQPQTPTSRRLGPAARPYWPLLAITRGCKCRYLKSFPSVLVANNGQYLVEGCALEPRWRFGGPAGASQARDASTWVEISGARGRSHARGPRPRVPRNHALPGPGIGRVAGALSIWACEGIWELGAMHDGGGQRGLATLCIGGGEAVAVVVERC
jgi:hypothetical protein